MTARLSDTTTTITNTMTRRKHKEGEEE